MEHFNEEDWQGAEWTTGRIGVLYLGVRRRMRCIWVHLVEKQNLRVISSCHFYPQTQLFHPTTASVFSCSASSGKIGLLVLIVHQLSTKLVEVWGIV